MAGAEQTLKIKIPLTLSERLSYFAKQSHTEPEIAVERMLDRYLPDIMRNFVLALEALNPEEQGILEESFYCVMFIVSYADEHWLIDVRRWYFSFLEFVLFTLAATV